MNYSPEQIRNMQYVDFMATLNEVNRAPGGNDSIRIMVQNTFLNSQSKVLDVGCNTGYCSFEIANLAKCYVTGVDINQQMIQASASNLETIYPHLQNRVNFELADGRKLDFPENSFDLVMSGGSTAFILDIPAAISEYARLVKPWGFVGDINFFYHTNPPTELIKNLNSLMGTDIQPWDINYWLNQYQKVGLEFYFQHTGKMSPVSDDKVVEYCKYLVAQSSWKEDVQQVATDKLISIMRLFNENHKYLAYGVFIMRKNFNLQRILF